MKKLDLGDVTLTVDEDFSLHTAVLRGTRATEIDVGGRTGTFRATMVIARTERALADREELERYVDLTVAVLQDRPGFEQKGRQALRTAAGQPAVLQHHRFRDERGVDVEQLQLFALQKGPAVVITATELAGGSFRARHKALRAMMLSATAAG